MATIALALALFLPSQDDKAAELFRLRRAAFEKRLERDRLLFEAHLALDRGDYDLAVAMHRAARRLESEAATMKRRETALIDAAVKALVADLESPDIEVRDSAGIRLEELGPPALAAMEKACKTAGNEEVRARLRQAIERIREMSIDDAGRLRQWASDAKASSEYSDTGWSAKQATGKPDTPTAGDNRTAWASKQPDAGAEWLELTYDRWVRPTHVRVRETFNPGAVVKVEARDAEDRWHVLWQGDDPTRESPGWFTASFGATKVVTRTIRVTLDSAAVEGWNEIDAVELIGDPAPVPKGK
ncbi:MAG: hypothetical protein HYY17_09940 [Planctomycetes bacterium]|nr:hypothetical protein [Planctomycetota bacterium]